MKRNMKSRVTSAAVAATFALGVASSTAHAEEIRIGWTAWADAEFVTKLAERLIEDRLDTEVELVQTDIAPQYTGVAQGDIDVMLMSWQPVTHGDYIEQFGNELVSISVLYDHARLGWIVPKSLYEEGVTSIEDLKDPAVRDRLNGEIQGIDPGAGLTRLSHDVIDEYDLDYTLIEASGAAMTAALDRADRRGNPIVVTGWSPHWKFGAYDLKYLDDPKGVLGGPERIHAMARKGFYGDHQAVAGFLTRMFIPLDDLQAAMYEARERSTSEAIDAYIDNNAERVNYWVTGEI